MATLGIRPKVTASTVNRPLTFIPERLKQSGYTTAAFVSAFAVARRFGVARGFNVYDDEFGAERVGVVAITSITVFSLQDACRRRATGPTACRRRITSLRWRSSSAPRSACC